MVFRSVIALTSIGSVMAIAMAGLHASGFNYVSQSLIDSNAPDFLKEILPAIFLYPSIILIALVVFNFIALVNNQAVSFTLAASALFFVAHSALGFILGGLIPGSVLLFTSMMFALASFFAKDISTLQ